MGEEMGTFLNFNSSLHHVAILRQCSLHLESADYPAWQAACQGGLCGGIARWIVCGAGSAPGGGLEMPRGGLGAPPTPLPCIIAQKFRDITLHLWRFLLMWARLQPGERQQCAHEAQCVVCGQGGTTWECASLTPTSC